MKIKIAVSYLILVLLLMLLATLGMYRAGIYEGFILLALVGLFWLIGGYLLIKNPHWPWLGTILFLQSWGVFPLMTYIVKYVYQWSADDLLYHLDQKLWGGETLAAYFHYEDYPLWADVISACYFFFYFLVLGSVIYFSIKRKISQRFIFFNSLILLYAIGFLSYLLFPAAGPAFTVLPQQNGGGALTQWVTQTVNAGVTGMDVFPSLHTAISIFIVGFIWQCGYKKLSLILIPVSIGTIFATIFLRYHYGIDVLVGTLVGIYILYFSHRQLKQLLDSKCDGENPICNHSCTKSSMH